MATYIVEIDSNYRDVNQYQIQTDYAVSFETNTSTSIFTQGLPLTSFSTSGSNTGTYYNNFYSECSIDPDYLNTNISVSNGYLQDIQYDKENRSYYIAGIAFGQTGGNTFSVNSQSGALFVSNFVNTLSPFLVKLTQNFDNTFLFNWGILARGFYGVTGYITSTGANNTVLLATPYSDSSNCKISKQGGVYWEFNSNYTQYSVNYFSTGGIGFTGSELYYVVPTGTYQPDSVNTSVFAFDQNGSYYFVDNRPWGYHIYTSTFKQLGINPNYKSSLLIDDAENFYVSQNLNPFDYPYAFSTNVDLWKIPQSQRPINNQYPRSTTFIYLNMTGTTGSYTGAPSGPDNTYEFFMVIESTFASVALVRQSCISVYRSSPTSLNNFEFHSQISLTGYITFPVSSISDTNSLFTYGKFCYLIAGAGDNSSSDILPVRTFKIDPIKGVILNSSSTTQLFNAPYILGSLVGTKYYFAVRTNATPTIYVYSYDLLTDTLSSALASLVLPSGVSTTKYASTSLQQSDTDPDKLIIVSPDFIPSTASTTRVGILCCMTYSISGGTLTLNSSFPLTFTNGLSINQYKTNRKLYFVYSYTIPGAIDIFDVTNPSSPVIANTLTTRTLRGASVASYTSKNGDVNYVLSAAYGGRYASVVYNVNDPVNAYIISQTYAPNQASIANVQFNTISPDFITPEGFCYSTSLGAGNASYYGKLRFHMQDAKLSSSHYYKNIESMASLVSNGFTVFDVAGKNFIITSSVDTLYIYSYSSFIISLVSTFTYTTPFSSSVVALRTFTNGTAIYISVLNSQSCYVLTCNLNGTSISFLTSFPSVSTSLVSSTFLYTSNATPSYLFFFLCEAKGLVLKYSIDQITNTFTLVASSTFTPSPATRSISNIETNFSTNGGIYVLTLQMYIPGNLIGTATNGAVQFINVTNLSTLSSLAAISNITRPFRYLKLIETPIVNNLTTTPYTLQRGNYVGQQGVTNQTQFGYLPPGTQFISTGVGSWFTLDLLQSGQSAMWTDRLFDKSYQIYNSNGNINQNDTLSILDVTIPQKASTIVGTTTISVPGNVLDIKILQSDSFSYAVVLTRPCYTGPTGSAGVTGPTGSSGPSIGNNMLFIYDVSNVDFASKYRNLTVESSSFDNLQVYGGGSFIHSGDYLGKTNWVSVIGSSSSGALGFGIGSSGLVKDELNELYIVGGWGNSCSFYQSFGDSLDLYPSNSIIDVSPNIKGIIGKLSINSGKWKYAVPLIGTADVFMVDAKYSNSNNILCAALYYSSKNLYVYSPQESISPSITGVNSQEFTIQHIFQNTSSTTSSLLALDTGGIYSWSSTINTFTPNSIVNVKSLFIDEDGANQKILCSGIGDSDQLEGIDSSSDAIQSLYPNMQASQSYNFIYSFSLTGSYLSSQYVSFPNGSSANNIGIYSFSDINQFVSVNSINMPFQTGAVTAFNKDSTLGGSVIYRGLQTICPSTFYVYDSIFTDSNQFKYSEVFLYNYTGPSIIQNLTNYQLFILGYSPDDVYINKNFVIRYSEFDPTTSTMKLTLNQSIQTNLIDRRFSVINNITGSNFYYSSNLSKSQLYDVGLYSSITGTSSSGTILFDTLYNNQGTFDTTKEYYFAIPQSTGTTGTYTSIIPITSVVYNNTTGKYTMNIQNVNDLRVPSPSGPFYGPYLNILEKNYSAYYSLQWYPGARVFSQTYTVGLYDLIIPNRPVRNSRYPGLRFLNDYPYVYLIIYNSDINDRFDPSVVNSVYDNNVDVPRFALFQIPTTTFSPLTNSNYFSASSSATPKIKFSPGFYNLHVKLTDDRGNVIIFDNTPYKDSDSIFADGVVPDTLLNIVTRFAFRRG